MSDVLKDYFDALERLKRGKTLNVPKGTRITNDSVSQEAGRKKGTIKKSRPIFSALISAIDAAAKTETKPKDEMRARLEEAKAAAARYRRLWEEALVREISLVKEIWDARETWARDCDARMRGRVAPFRKPRA